MILAHDDNWKTHPSNRLLNMRSLHKKNSKDSYTAGSRAGLFDLAQYPRS